MTGWTDGWIFLADEWLDKCLDCWMTSDGSTPRDQQTGRNEVTSKRKERHKGTYSLCEVNR